MKSAKAERIAQLTVEAARIERQIAVLKLDDAGLDVDEAACRLMKEKPAEFKDYSAALDHVLKSDESLAARYVAAFGEHKLSPALVKTFRIEDTDDDDGEKGKGSAAAGVEIDRLVLAWLKERGLSDSEDYPKGLGAILQAHPDLAKKWMGR